MSRAKRDHQKILGADGEALFVLVPAAEYDELCRAADDIEDLRAAGATLALGSEGTAPVPAIVAHRIADGENPVRVWREYRGMKAIELARAAGMSAPYLSEIETGKKDGTFRTMAAIASVLCVSLDDLAPPADEEDRRARERAALVDGVRAQIRKIVALVTGPSAFDTGAVRRAVTTLVGDAVSLKAQEPHAEDWLGEVLEGHRSQTPRLPPRARTLLVWGEHDAVFPLPLAERLQRKLGDLCQLEVLKKAAHAPNIEKKRRFNRVVLKFLAAP